MATYTEHYNFPKYEATDLPNLLDQYNNFADTADAQIYGMNSTVQAAQQAAQNATNKAESVESQRSTARLTGSKALSTARRQPTTLAQLPSMELLQPPNMATFVLKRYKALPLAIQTYQQTRICRNMLHAVRRIFKQPPRKPKAGPIARTVSQAR